ncbi:hypothetical protein ACQUSR_13770 [Streptomyces sp. P1-3]|uniref:hypothetical protein n=1 Tax=Streptomyces sp. P1-3 TaxID=3421658 RepID=UPI003D3605AB
MSYSQPPGSGPGYGYQQSAPGHPAPYGQAPPPGGGRNGKTGGLVIAAMVAIVATVGGIVLFTGSDDDGKKSRGPGEAMVAPQEVYGYTLQSGPPEYGDPRAKAEEGEQQAMRRIPGLTGPKSTIAWYSGGSMGRSTMKFKGITAESVGNQEMIADHLLKTDAQYMIGPDAVPVGDPQGYAYEDFGSDVLKCQDFKTGHTPAAMCVWVGSTVGEVALDDTFSMNKDTAVEVTAEMYEAVG